MKRVKFVLAVLLGFFLLVLILQNTAPVRTRVLSGSLEMPLAFTLLGCVLAGFGLGWFACWYRHRRRSTPTEGGPRQP